MIVREGTASDRRFTVLARVRCLDCGNVYAKPSEGGTVEENPGCPQCGYLGWIPAAVDFNRDAAPSRSVVDLRQRRASRRR
jgi:predicted  nucleic acid-binding Zn-ribbon protein